MANILIEPALLAAICKRIDDVEYGWDGRHPHAAPPPTYAEDKVRLRQIGEAANDAGGFAMMQHVAQAAALTYRNTLNTVNSHWHGIGEWEA